MNIVSGMPPRTSLPDGGDRADRKIYYHYTSLETLWALLDGDTLRACHARFSNDSEEIKRGEKLLKEICEARYQQAREEKSGHEEVRKKMRDYIDKLEKDEKSGIDCYIVCFCKSNDKLSQWRAYCRDDGVSIGFELGEEIQYCLRDQPYKLQAVHREKLCEIWYVSDEKGGRSRTGQVEGIITPKELQTQIEKKLDEFEEKEVEQQKSALSSMISRIKHAGFYEEEEYRLILQNDLWSMAEEGSHPLDPYIQYRKDAVRSPYLNLTFGKTYEAPGAEASEEAIEAYKEESSVQEITAYNLNKKAERLLKKRLAPVEILCLKEKGSASKRVVIGMGTEAHQEECFRKVENVIDETYPREKKAVSIWCEGHLPIRSITVSPCRNQDEVVESIRHYCHHGKFWLKYVQVEGSKIPYRRPK